MSQEVIVKRSWGDTFRAWLHPKVIAMLFLGFSAGLPYLLIFSTLSVWLVEAGVEKSAVTFFSWAALGYSFKFLWAPLVDLLPLPGLTRVLGRRRAWLLVAQLLIVSAIVCMALVDPAGSQRNLTFMAFAAVMLGFSSATQDIVIDAYRIESAEESLQAMLAAMYIAGYRVGMLVAGAGSLFLAGYLGTTSEAYNYTAWKLTYMGMAAVMCCGVATTLLIREPKANRRLSQYEYSIFDYGQFLSLFVFSLLAFAVTFFYSGSVFEEMENLFPQLFLDGGGVGAFLIELSRFVLAVGVAAIVAGIMLYFGIVNKDMVQQSYLEPIKDFFLRYSGRTALLLLVLIGFYRLSDIVLGVVSNVFYLDMGFSKNVIAGVTKTFGLGMTLAGGFLGGILTIKFGVNKILFLGAFLSAATNLLFMLLARTGGDVSMLTVVIGADNLSAGIATTAFIAFLSSLTNISFTAVQYAIFSSMMTLCPKLLGGYSGSMVSAFGYEKFFLVTAIMGIPVLFLVVAVRKAVCRE
jgi:PAT family beta-lactamase induction signal transducer AmpG